MVRMSREEASEVSCRRVSRQLQCLFCLRFAGMFFECEEHLECFVEF